MATQKSEAFEWAHSERHKVGQNQSMQSATVSHIKWSNATFVHNIHDRECDFQIWLPTIATNVDTHLANSVDCPAKSANCKVCGKTGHF